MRLLASFIIALCCSASGMVWSAAVDVPYPSGTPSAADIIAQVWYVNHFRAVKKFAIRKQGKDITHLIYRNGEGKYRFRTLERFLKNDFPADSAILAQDMAIFRYPSAVNGTAFLITDPADAQRSQELVVWLPALRKPRRFTQPSHDDAYAGTDFNFDDVALRRPEHETHKLLRTERFSQAEEGGGKLHVIEVPPEQQQDFMGFKPTPHTEFAQRDCYVVESTTTFKDYWYDYRVSWIDTETFADYRTLSYKNGKLVKIIDRDWRPMRNHPGSPDMADPRAQFWTMWYGKTLATGHESMAVIPSTVSEWNTDIPDDFWSVSYLERTQR
jgi:hypothetical protein